MPDHIFTAADVYPMGTGAERCFVTWWPKDRPLEPMKLPTKVASKTASVYVTVNDNRWVIVCPNCSEGQVAAKDDPRFCCFKCLNANVDGAWRPVIWPKNAAAIENELLRRPNRSTRNWAPPETIADLKKETKVRLRVD